MTDANWDEFGFPAAATRVHRTQSERKSEDSVSRCARCGRPIGEAYDEDECAVSVAGDECEGALLPATVACRDAELSNLCALLRSVTGKLENAAALLESPTNDVDTAAAMRLVESVLEVLS